jgi:hypothetical protein
MRLSQISKWGVLTVMKKLWVILFVSLFVSMIAYAENIKQQKLSLSNVIEIALKNHPQIEASQARLAEASGRRQISPSLPPAMISYASMGERGPYQGLMQATAEVSQQVLGRKSRPIPSSGGLLGYPFSGESCVL